MNLNQITVPSIDVLQSVAFYKNLGLQLIVLAEERYARFECPEGDSTFSIHHVDQLPSGDGISVYFEVDDVAQKVSELKSKGVSFKSESTDQPWLWTEARLKDPDGNQLIIFNAGDNRKNPPWRIQEL